MNDQVSPPAAPPPPPAPNAAEQQQQWETMRTSLAGGNADRARALEGFASPDALFEKINAPAPPDWREQMSGGDAEALTFLNKYADPQQAFKAWKSATSKLSEGGRIKLPGEGASEEELGEYRKAVGIPDKADGYTITAKPADGYEVSDADKAFLGGMTERLHDALSKGAKPEQLVNLATQIYYDASAQAVLDEENRAADAHFEAEQINRKLWGSKYEENIGWGIAGAKQFFTGSDAEFEELMGLKLSTGHALFDHPKIQQIFAQVGREHAEDPFFLAQKDRNSGFDPEKRINEIRALRNGTSDQRKQYAQLSAPGGELEKLLNGMEKQKGRAA